MEFPFEEVIKLGRQYFLIDPKLRDLIKNIKLDPFSVGVFLGECKKIFKPSIALIKILAKYTDDKIYVNDKSAWLFGCGRDLFPENIIKGSSAKRVIVLNEKKEVLGYAIKKREGNRKIYQNNLDIGNYLRREKS